MDESIRDLSLAKNSEEAFEIMDKQMPGGEAIRFSGKGADGIRKSETIKAIRFLKKLRNAYFLSDLDYYFRELIKLRIDSLINDLQMYVI